MKILIIGAGISGCGAADLALAQNFNVTVIDQFSSEKLIRKAALLEQKGAQVILNCSIEMAVQLAASAKQIILSPGIDPNGFYQAVLQTENVISELEFGAAFCHCPLYCITGTNGKTTTVEMSVHIMNHNGRKVIAAGNIGYPLSLAALKSNTLDAIVVEVSSFQLEKVNAFKADAAVILNISSDHINRYDSFSHYAETKLRLLQATDKKANRLINHSIKMLSLKCAESETFGGHRSELQQSSATCRYKNQTIFSKADLAVKGDHNFENAMAAAWLSLKSGLKPDQIAQSLSSFQSGAHRLELIYKSEGIQIYNDSKSTNPDALCRAIETVRSPNTKNIILIAGGRDKMMDFSKSVKLLQNNVKTAILIGETKTRLKQVWKNSAKCLISTNLKDAVNTAFEELSGNETILLSPGCASQDMFRDYKARGEVFRDEILRRINNENL